MKSSPVLSTPLHSTTLYETDCEFSCNLLTRFTTAYVYMFFVFKNLLILQGGFVHGMDRS